MTPIELAQLLLESIQALESAMQLRARFLPKQDSGLLRLDLQRALDEPRAAARNVTDESRHLASSIPLELLEVWTQRATEAVDRLVARVRDPQSGPAEWEDALREARNVVCGALKKIKQMNAGRLPTRDLEVRWSAFQCEGDSTSAAVDDVGTAQLPKQPGTPDALSPEGPPPLRPSWASGMRVGKFTLQNSLSKNPERPVFVASDNLQRTVVLKYLGPTNNESLRFIKREAELLARLKHKNIASIHGLHELDGMAILEMEFVSPGRSLRQWLSQASPRLEDKVSVLEQVASALAAVHRAGVVHQDVKPDNVVINDEGHAKVIDFGLASRLEQTDRFVDLDASQVTTLSDAPKGLTPAYASPERLAGAAPSIASDIWSFGCTAFEILTGALPFRAETYKALAHSVLQDTPNWGKLPSELPAGIRGLVRRCLEKQAAHRPTSMDEVLRFLRGDVGTVARHPILNGPRPQDRAVRWVGLTFLTLLGLFGAAQLMRARPERFDFGPFWSGGASFALSPTGTSIAFVRSRADGKPTLMLHDLDTGSLREIAPGRNPFYSPTGRYLAYFTEEKLKLLDTRTNVTYVKASISTPAGGAWGSDNRIVVAMDRGLRDLAIATPEGDQELEQRVTCLGEGKWAYWPTIASNGDVLFFRGDSTITAKAAARIWVQPHDPQNALSVEQLEQCATIAPTGYERDANIAAMSVAVSLAHPGIVFFLHDGSLRACQYDEEKHRATSTCIDFEGIRPSSTFYFANFGVSANFDVIAFAEESPDQPAPSLIGTSRQGLPMALPKSLEQQRLDPYEVAVSRDGRYLAVSNNEVNHIVSIYDLREDAAKPIVLEGIGDTHGLTWGKDNTLFMTGEAGGRLCPGTRIKGSREVFCWNPTMGSNSILVDRLCDGGYKITDTVSKDGSVLITQRRAPAPSKTGKEPDGGRDDGPVRLMAVPLAGEAKRASGAKEVFKLAATDSLSFVQARFSDDGKCLAYVAGTESTTESEWNVFAVATPDANPKNAGGALLATAAWRLSASTISISPNGGHSPVWSRDSESLFFLSGRSLFEAKRVPETCRFEPPEKLFSSEFSPVEGSLAGGVVYDANRAPEGPFFFSAQARRPSIIRVIRNWSSTPDGRRLAAFAHSLSLKPGGATAP